MLWSSTVSLSFDDVLGLMLLILGLFKMRGVGMFCHVGQAGFSGQ